MIYLSFFRRISVPYFGDANFTTATGLYPAAIRAFATAGACFTAARSNATAHLPSGWQRA